MTEIPEDFFSQELERLWKIARTVDELAALFGCPVRYNALSALFTIDPDSNAPLTLAVNDALAMTSDVLAAWAKEQREQDTQ